MFSYHNFVFLWFIPCNKILLDFCFSRVVFLVLFFYDQDLEPCLSLFLSWLRNLVDLVVFVPMKMYGV